MNQPAARAESTVITQRTSLVAKFASRYSIDAEKLLPILKATAFKVRDGEATNEQMAALLVVADQYGLNPFTREIFAFPDKQSGIIPVVGVDGWSRIINDHAQSDGLEFVDAEQMVEGAGHKPCPAWMECVIYRKDRAHAIKVREYFDEVYRPAFVRKDGSRSEGPWQTHTKRMLRHKVLIQAARLAYGFTGIYDEDEAERIIERDVTPPPPQVERSAGAALKAAVAGTPPVVTPNPAPASASTAANTVLDPLAEGGDIPKTGAAGVSEGLATDALEAEIGAEATPKSTAKTKTLGSGTPRLRKIYLEKLAEAKDKAVLDLVYDETSLCEWPEKDRDELMAAYLKRIEELRPA